MDITTVTLLLVCGLLSGLMNTLASSGSAITLPAMIFLGVPPSMANATNRLPILVGSTISVYNFQRSKEIIWSNLAKLQFSNVVEYYALRNGNANYSLKLVDEVEDLLETLSKAELIGRLTSNKFTRIISMKVYLIFYEINGNRIEIVSFWDNKQDIENRKIK
jgi:plasmid stabilization system protein ParE